MARLAGPTVAELSTTHTNSQFNGFGGNNGSKPAEVADVAGTITGVSIQVNSFGDDSFIQVNLYKRRGGAGAYSLVGYTRIPNTEPVGSPQLGALTISGDATCEVGDEFTIIQAGDFSSQAANGGSAWTSAVDQNNPQGTNDGVYGIGGAFYSTTPPASTNYDITPEAAGRYWFQVDGTTGATTDLVIDFEVCDAGGNPLPDQDFQVQVTADSVDGAEVVPLQTVTSSGGVVRVDSQLLLGAGNTYIGKIRPVSNPPTSYEYTPIPGTVVDLNA
jgi:hypothetical protein